MSLTARHKKPGGFRKLVNSLECTPPQKREKILEALRKEDPDFIHEVEKSIFSFEEFEKINDLIICEIVGAMKGQMRSLAMALFKCPNETLVQKFLKNMKPAEVYEYREALETFKEIRGYEQVAGRFKIIEKARELERQKKFTLKRYSAAYPDD